MKIWHLNKVYKGHTEGIYPAEINGCDSIDVTDDSQTAKNIRNGYGISIEDDLSITTVPPVPSAVDVQLAVLKDADNAGRQKDELIKLLLLERNITPL